MRVFKQKRNGKPYKKWTVEFTDPSSTRRRIQGFTDKGATEAFGHKLEKLVSYRVARRALDPELTDWIEGLSQKMLERIGALGLVDGETTAAAKPLMVATRKRRKQSSTETFEVTGGHLADFERHMKARELRPQHISQVISHCARLIDACKWIFPSQIDTDGLEAYIGHLRENGTSARTANAALSAFTTFCNWMKKQGRLTHNPASRVAKLNEKADRRLIRRAMTPEQIRRLLVATEAAEHHHGLSGHERALLYRLALETGLRHGEIRKLRRVDFHLESNPASVHIRAQDEKAGRGDVLPLRPALADALRAYFADRLAMPSTAAFPGMGSKGADMLRADLDAAGVDWTADDRGAVLDFHSLRHTFGTMLAAAGVHPKTAMDLMRHSDINLTMGLYSHTLIEDRAKATAALPDFTAAAAVAKTGTADIPDETPPGPCQTEGEKQGALRGRDWPEMAGNGQNDALVFTHVLDTKKAGNARIIRGFRLLKVGAGDPVLRLHAGSDAAKMWFTVIREQSLIPVPFRTATVH